MLVGSGVSVGDGAEVCSSVITGWRTGRLTVGTAVGEGVGVAVGAGSGVAVGSSAGVAVGAAVAVGLGAGIAVAVGVKVGTGVYVGAGVHVGTGVQVGATVGSGPGAGPQAAMMAARENAAATRAVAVMVCRMEADIARLGCAGVAASDCTVRGAVCHQLDWLGGGWSVPNTKNRTRGLSVATVFVGVLEMRCSRLCCGGCSAFGVLISSPQPWFSATPGLCFAACTAQSPLEVWRCVNLGMPDTVRLKRQLGAGSIPSGVQITTTAIR